MHLKWFLWDRPVKWHTSLLFTFYWLKLCHKTTSNCKEGWEIQSSYVHAKKKERIFVNT